MDGTVYDFTLNAFFSNKRYIKKRINIRFATVVRKSSACFSNSKSFQKKRNDLSQMFNRNAFYTVD